VENSLTSDTLGSHAFYRGSVFHRRLIHPRYTFTYSVFNVLLDIDRIDELSRRLCFFSHNRFNLFSFYDRDHLPKHARAECGTVNLRAWVEQGLRQHGIELGGGQVHLFCFPRILGFVFNPLSVWYCRDPAGELRAIVCEVRNTFGERHCYLLRHPENEVLDLSNAYHHPKRFHVSPFLPISGDYEFRFSPPADQLDVGIVWIENEKRAMVATQRMRSQPVTDWTLLKTIMSMPFMTAKVVTAIHWQALKIWVRGAQFYKKPAPPKKEISSDV
jgi:DUF1365 family protein